MFGIFIKSFFRNILKNRAFFLVNLLGFTLGLCVSFLIFLYIANEMRYDKYHEKSDRIYRLCIRASIGDTRFEQAFSSARVLREMRERFPEIEDAVKTYRISDITARVDEKIYYENLLVMADSSLFSIFTLPLINGNPKTALAEPNSVALSESYARKYFGSTDCLGKVIEVDVPGRGKSVYTVSAVYSDMPDQSHFHLDLFVSSTTFPERINSDGWSANNFITYLLLKERTSYTELEKKFVDYVIDVFGGEEEYNAFIAQGDYWDFFLQPLERIHLYSDVTGEWETNGNIKYIFIFSAVALFVLIIACINFVNLSIAKSTLRAREVGIRKVNGSSRRQLVLQFLGESAIITFLAMILSLVIIKILLPYYNDWLDRSISLNLFTDGRMIAGALAAWLVISILSGIYPAIFLSSYKPVRVLKASTVSETRGLGIRNVLVILQFAASILLIICTIVITKEMKMLQDRNLGFDKSNVLIVQIPVSFSDKQQIIMDDLKRFPVVQYISYASSLPGKGFANIGFGAESIDKNFTLNVFSADQGYDDVLKLEMSDGRFFSPEILSDSTAVLLNETAVKVLGIENPLGKYIYDHGSTPYNYIITGIIKDFHYESKHREMRPMGIFFQGGPKSGNISCMAIRFSPGNNKEALEAAESVWDKHMPGIPFNHSYLAEDYDSLYQNELQTKQVFTLLSFLAILVACMGLFGLASFISQQRRQEVAIRKVMGASISQLINLLIYRYIRWLAIAFVIACPLGYYIMSQWLNNFAFKVSIGPFIYIIAGVVTMILALFTVSGITGRTANCNPAIVLRNE